MGRKVKKITMLQLLDKVAVLKAETNLPITVETIPEGGTYKVNLVYTAGITKYPLLGEPLSVREASKVVDTITLLCQMEIRFPVPLENPITSRGRLEVNTGKIRQIIADMGIRLEPFSSRLANRKK